MLSSRSSGILLHISSLPGEYGIGDFGAPADKFVKFLKNAGQTCWQMLPLNYITAGNRFSPYKCLSAFAGNPLFVSPQLLRRDGLLSKKHLEERPKFSRDYTDYKKVESYKSTLFDIAFANFSKTKKPVDYAAFVKRNSFWLEEFSLFLALKQRFKNRIWCDWPVDIRDRKKQALKEAGKDLDRQIKKEKFLQYIFYKQYISLKRRCNRKGIQIFGDLPIYVAYDSADVWSAPEMFKLASDKKPEYIAGVPPDYFSRTGQLWGNPVYNWKRLKARGYQWWIRRLEHNLQLFDILRIDHFRGFVAYWQVPAGSKTATKGRWIKAPAEDFFNTVLKQMPSAQIVAEDLGQITPDVREIINKFNFPCMKVLHFAFDGEPKKNTHLPHNHVKNCVVYTGTHDNNTTRGWFKKELNRKQKQRLSDYLGRKPSEKNVHRRMIRLAMSSVANLVIIPMQDILGLDGKTRMNNPALTRGNWRYRMLRLPDSGVIKDLKNITFTYGRS